MIVLFASDLMMSSSVSGFASSVGVDCQTAGDCESVAELVQRDGQFLLLIDLGYPAFVAEDLAATVPTDVLENAIAYGPHVHVEKLQAARNAGIGTVISRGQFSSQMGQLISSFASR